MAGEELIKNGAEPINISRARELRVLTGGLLGRDVARRAQNFQRACDCAVGFDKARETEVGEVRFTLRIEQDIAGLDVAMQDAALMRVLDGAGETGDDFCRAPQREGFAPNELIEVAAFFEFHAEVAGAVALADLVDRNDARMLEAGGRLSFALEAFQMRFGRPMAETR